MWRFDPLIDTRAFAVGPGHCVDGLVLYAGAVGSALLIIHEIWGPKFGIQLDKGGENLESTVE
jgi:hypothetical protein